MHPSASTRYPQYLDPVFAITIGISAAVVRIRREEREKGRETGEMVEILSRRLGFGRSAESNMMRGSEGKTELGAVVGNVD